MAMFDSPYEDSYYYNPTGGTDTDFFAYLKRLQAERRGGILGGGMFGRMGEAAKEKAEVNASDVLGELINKQTGAGGDSGTSAEELAQMSEEANTPFNPNNPYDRLSGRTWAPELWGAMDWLDRQAIRSDLLRTGYSEAEIERILNNPELAKAMASGGAIDTKNAGIAYDYNQAGQSENLLQALFGSERQDGNPRVTNQLPFSPYDLSGRDGMFSGGAGVVVAGNPYSTNDIAMIRKAQADANRPLFSDLNMSTISAQAQAGADAAVERERIAEQARQRAAAEAARNARIEADRQAEAKRRATAAAAQAAINAAAGRSYTDSYAPSSVRSSGDSYTVTNSNTGYSANFSSSPSFGSGTFDTSGTFGD